MFENKRADKQQERHGGAPKDDHEKFEKFKRDTEIFCNVLEHQNYAWTSKVIQMLLEGTVLYATKNYKVSVTAGIQETLATVAAVFDTAVGPNLNKENFI